MLQVGEVARKLGLNPQTLYFYERIGLLFPTQRTKTGYRLYDEKDLERLSFITRTKALGLSLEEIQELLKLKDEGCFSCEEVQKRLLKKVEEIEDKIQQLEHLKAELLIQVERSQEGIKISPLEHQCVIFQEN